MRFKLLKTTLLSALMAAILGAGQPVAAQSTPLSTLNTGLNDAWVSAEAPNQGIFITVFPELGLVFLAWFTFDAQVPVANSWVFGSGDHRWVTAVGAIDGSKAELTAELTTGGQFNSADPVPAQQSNYGTIVLEFASCEEALLNFDFPSAGQSGEFVLNRALASNIGLCEKLAEPVSICERAAPDLSHGQDDPPILEGGAIIPSSEVFDAGPGADGIPPLEFPRFTQDHGSANLNPLELVVGVKYGDTERAYPHDILNWHEVVNDRFTVDGESKSATLNYCPLTGSAMLWKPITEDGDQTYGTSGLLYNSNLVMYDRATRSFWSQMLEQAVFGDEIKRVPDRLQAVETNWETWKSMYPETLVLTEDTGFSRDYTDYPYDTFRTDNNLIWPANNSNDNRLHRKERVLGINVGPSSKVWPISSFATPVEVINEAVGGMPVVVAGSSGLNFGVVYNRELEDCTVVEFQAVQDKLPVVMRDNEGNEWDVFGNAVSGPRVGEQLQKTNSYISYWFAWTAFYPGAEIHQ